MPGVSIVIPTHNYGCFLREAIDSALAQTVPPLEVLVLDDGSTDDTKAIVESYGDKVAYYYFDHLGVYTVRQKAVSLVKGDLYLNLDADDRLDPSFIEKTLACYEEQPDLKPGFVYTQQQLFGGRDGVSTFPAYSVDELKKKNFIMMTSLIRVDLLRKHGFDPAFNEGYGDYDFYLTLAEKGIRGVRVDEPLVQVRIHDASITSSVRKKNRQIQLVRRLIKKHRALFTHEEEKQALFHARHRVLLAACHARRKGAPLSEKLRDLYLVLGTRLVHREVAEQVLYIVCPPLYFFLRARNVRT